jgi:hypothetical protein
LGNSDLCLIFEYRYRDAGNYKADGRVLLHGELTPLERNEIEAKLESGEFFVAEQVGLPTLYHKLFAFSGGRTPDDHAWHEFVGFQTVSSDFHRADDDFVIGASELINSFRSVGCWKPELSSNF